MMSCVEQLKQWEWEWEWEDRVVKMRSIDIKNLSEERAFLEMTDLVSNYGLSGGSI